MNHQTEPSPSTKHKWSKAYRFVQSFLQILAPSCSSWDQRGDHPGSCQPLVLPQLFSVVVFGQLHPGHAADFHLLSSLQPNTIYQLHVPCASPYLLFLTWAIIQNHNGMSSYFLIMNFAQLIICFKEKGDNCTHSVNNNRLFIYCDWKENLTWLSLVCHDCA